jgi:hypothetical protein
MTPRSIMERMKASRHQVLLPAVSTAGSFLLLLLLLVLTSPLNNIAFAGLFFVLFLILLISLGYLISLFQTGRVSSKSRGRIISVSVFIVVLLMLRSAGSLSWVGGLILILIVGGWLFYGSHRP